MEESGNLITNLVCLHKQEFVQEVHDFIYICFCIKWLGLQQQNQDYDR
jgi:hypothetical protein